MFLLNVSDKVSHSYEPRCDIIIFTFIDSRRMSKIPNCGGSKHSSDLICSSIPGKCYFELLMKLSMSLSYDTILQSGDVSTSIA
jgi:hypothetical protein